MSLIGLSPPGDEYLEGVPDFRHRRGCEVRNALQTSSPGDDSPMVDANSYDGEVNKILVLR